MNFQKTYKLRINQLLLYLFILPLIFSCGGGDLEDDYETAISLKQENKIMDSNKLLHKIIESDGVSLELKIKSIFTISQLYYDVKDYPRSIEYFKKLLTEKIENDYRKKSLFMIAYTYNNHLDMYTDAINYYEKFLLEYKDDDLVPSVEYELEQIKKIINKIEN